MLPRVLALVSFCSALSCCASSAQPPIVGEKSGVLKQSADGLTADELGRFSDLVMSSTAGWSQSNAYSAVTEKLEHATSGIVGLLIAGASPKPAIVAAGFQSESGPLLVYSTAWEKELHVLPRTAEWWAAFEASARKIQQRNACSPRLEVKDSSTLFVRVSEGTSEHELVTYGLPPRFPHEPRSGTDVSPCFEDLLDFARLLEEPAVRDLEKKAPQTSH